MMKLQTYASFSFIAAVSAVTYAFNSRRQFYPAMVYLSTSKICFVVLSNMGLAIMCITWKFIMFLFLGSLREAEVERLNEQCWREVIEILFALTIFRQEFSVSFFTMVTALLLIKALHWLAQKRLEYIETTPSVPLLTHVRIISFMVFLLAINCLSVHNFFKSLIQTKKASIELFFAFEYTILAITTMSMLVKYVFYLIDMLIEGQWDKKPVWTFYLELIRDLLHLSLYIIFFLVISANYGIPLHLIRELYETFRNFRLRISDYLRYRKITSNMDERFPNASQEELSASDATCIICREEMLTAKKLICGHLFHVHCLRSWLERQQTCPTCRALVVPAENRATGSGQQQHISESIQSGSLTQISDGGASNDNSSQHHSSVQAAVLAAALYEQSFPALPSRDASRYPMLVQNFVGSSRMLRQSSKEAFPDPQLNTLPDSSRLARNIDVQLLHLKAQADFIQNEIKVMQAQMQILDQQASFGGEDTTNAYFKGKAVASISSSPSSDSAGHHEIEGTAAQ